jgi:prepilin-type N-terminal cleavage/methylation domain-containing protein
MRLRRAVTLIELLVALLVLSVLSPAIYFAYTMSISMHDTVIGQNNSLAETRKGIDLMADHLRNAQLNTNTSSGVSYSALDSAAINDITYYAATGTSVVPTQIRIRLNNGQIEHVDGGTTTVLATDIQSLTLTYYKLTTYNGNWVLTTNANAPTTAELPYVAGIEIKVQVAMDGYTSEYKSVVRLRNSPRKSSLSGL